MSADPVEWEELNEKQVAAFASVTALTGSAPVVLLHPDGDMAFLASSRAPGIEIVADYDGLLDVWQINWGSPSPVAFNQTPEQCAYWLGCREN